MWETGSNSSIDLVIRNISDDVAGPGGDPREWRHLHGVQQGQHHRDDNKREDTWQICGSSEDREPARQVETSGQDSIFHWIFHYNYLPTSGSRTKKTHLWPAHNAQLRLILLFVLDLWFLLWINQNVLLSLIHLLKYYLDDYEGRSNKNKSILL